MSDGIEKLKKLTINMLQEEHDNHMESKKQLKNLFISIFLTILPVSVFMITPILSDKYFHVFSGRVMYTGQDHYFGFSPTFILDLPYFLPPIIWALALWFCFKTRKLITSRTSFSNFLILILIVLNAIFMACSLWFVLAYFLE